jgi:hypothetical protein
MARVRTGDSILSSGGWIEYYRRDAPSGQYPLLPITIQASQFLNGLRRSEWISSFTGTSISGAPRSCPGRIIAC